jgi:hypothetical protein
MVDLNHSVHRLAVGEQARDMPSAGLRKEKITHFIPISQVGHPTRNCAGTNSHYLFGPFNCGSQVMEILVGTNTATDEEDIHLRNIICRNHQGHIHQAILIDPFGGVEQRYLATCATRKL